MDSKIALLLADGIAGFHAALIVFFLVGWLIPFTSLVKRALLNLFIGGCFLLFQWLDFCPLTKWEYQLRAIADPASIEKKAFVEREVSHFFHVNISSGNIRIISFILIFFVLTLVILALRGNMKKGKVN